MYIPEERKVVDVCRGHKNEEKVERGKGEERKREIERQLSKDPEIESFYVTWEDRGRFHRDKVITKFKHIDDSRKCSKKNKQEVIVQKEVKEVSGQRWVYRNPKLADEAVNVFTQFILHPHISS